MPKSSSIKLDNNSKNKNGNKLNSILNRTLSDSILDKKSHGCASYFPSPHVNKVNKTKKPYKQNSRKRALDLVEFYF